MRYYVVSDVHGFCGLLKKSLEDAGFFDDTEPHKLVLCGDLLDRGPEANELIEFMLELLHKDELIYILGNHEDLFIQCLQQCARPRGFEQVASGMSHHYVNKTWDSFLQIAGMSEEEACRTPDELVLRIRNSSFYQELLPAALNYFETENYIFTHGWIPSYLYAFYAKLEYERNEAWRDAEIDEWKKARWLNGMDLACRYHVTEPDKTIVCGHWNCSYGHHYFRAKGSEFDADADHSPFYDEGIIAIDACTVASGRVNCVVIDD